MQSIALIGKARAGKDSIAARLTEAHGYSRLAFADNLKEAALATDPIIYGEDSGSLEAEYLRLSTAVREYGWERTKDGFPEVRRYLQHFGQSLRTVDPLIWVRPVMESLRMHAYYEVPCVVTDVRYLNEVEELRNAGALIVRVVRPGAGLTGDAAAHSSETELDDYEHDRLVVNDEDLAALHAAADLLVETA